jgi:hypothetical protein
MTTIINAIILFFLALLLWQVMGGTTGTGMGTGMMEGMTSNDASGNAQTSPSSISTSKSGIAGNVGGYLASIQSKVIQYQDQFLVSKYRTDYENTIVHLSTLVDCLMLETALNVDTANPMAAMSKLNTLNGTKLALNNVVKFIDKTA